MSLSFPLAYPCMQYEVPVPSFILRMYQIFYLCKSFRALSFSLSDGLFLFFQPNNLHQLFGPHIESSHEELPNANLTQHVMLPTVL